MNRILGKIIFVVFIMFVSQLLTPYIETHAASVNITPVTINRPNEIDTLKNRDEGVVWKKNEGDARLIYSFVLQERSWVIIDLNTTYFSSGSEYFKAQYITKDSLWFYDDASMSETINDLVTYISIDNYNNRFFAYLEPGKYYVMDRWDHDEITYAYILPNSAVIKADLKKKKGDTYSLNIEYTPHFGTTFLIDQQVKIGDMNSSDVWNAAWTNEDSVYNLNTNGDYTVKAVFGDKEWADFPVMYSFEILGINNNTKTDSDTEVKLDTSKKTLYEGDVFSLNLMNAAKKVKWKSSNKKVAKVKNGRVTAVGKGTVTITAKYDGKKYKCKIIVKKRK